MPTSDIVAAMQSDPDGPPALRSSDVACALFIADAMESLGMSVSPADFEAILDDQIMKGETLFAKVIGYETPDFRGIVERYDSMDGVTLSPGDRMVALDATVEYPADGSTPVVQQPTHVMVFRASP